MLKRRDFTVALAAGTATTVLFPSAQSALHARNVVLLRRLFADGSSAEVDLAPSLGMTASLSITHRVSPASPVGRDFSIGTLPRQA
jgi:hypothetical protein